MRAISTEVMSRGTTYRVTGTLVGKRIRFGAVRLVSEFNGRNEWKIVPSSSLPKCLDEAIASIRADLEA